MSDENKSRNNQTFEDKNSGKNENEKVFEAELDDEEQNEEEKKTEHVVRAVEAILASNENIIRIAETARKYGDSAKTEHLKLKRAARYIIRRYSNLAAAAGGAAAIPSLIPGIGKLYSIFGGSIVDVVSTLKFEVEMALCLCSLFGYDITQERERKLAFLLASSAISDIYAPKDSKIRSFLEVIDIAMWEYSSRQMTKSMLKIFGQAVYLFTTKRFLKLMPVIGIAVGASVNKIVTAHAGMKCTDALFERKAYINAKINE